MGLISLSSNIEFMAGFATAIIGLIFYIYKNKSNESTEKTSNIEKLNIIEKKIDLLFLRIETMQANYEKHEEYIEKIDLSFKEVVKEKMLTIETNVFKLISILENTNQIKQNEEINMFLNYFKKDILNVIKRSKKK